MNDLSLQRQDSHPAICDDINSLLSHLQCTDGTERQHAREALGRIGRYVVPSLIQLLSQRNEHTRWEACKTLGRIGDPSAGLALTEALCDEDMDVRWVAAEALAALEHNSIEPLLILLEQHFDSIIVRESAHHVLHLLKREFCFHESIEAVYDALANNVPTPRLAIAAMGALRHMTMNDTFLMKRKERFH
jgi:hypothetical protein